MISSSHDLSVVINHDLSKVSENSKKTFKNINIFFYPKFFSNPAPINFLITSPQTLLTYTSPASCQSMNFECASCLMRRCNGNLEGELH